MYSPATDAFSYNNIQIENCRRQFFSWKQIDGAGANVLVVEATYLMKFNEKTTKWNQRGMKMKAV